MPRREDSELTRMLMPTSTAPIRKKLLTVTASKVGLLAAGQGEGDATGRFYVGELRRQDAGRMPSDSNLRIWRTVKGRLRFFSKEFQGFRVVRASARGLAGVAARQRQPGVHART